jgi:hypothetical protein
MYQAPTCDVYTSGLYGDPIAELIGPVFEAPSMFHRSTVAPVIAQLVSRYQSDYTPRNPSALSFFFHHLVGVGISELSHASTRVNLMQSMIIAS